MFVQGATGAIVSVVCKAQANLSRHTYKFIDSTLTVHPITRSLMHFNLNTTVSVMAVVLCDSRT